MTVAATGLPLFDHVCVLGKSARVEEERRIVAIANRTNRANVFEADRLPAAAVVRYREHHQRNTVRADVLEQSLELAQVHVALEGVPRRRDIGFVDHQIHRGRTGVLRVRPRRVEVVVVGYDHVRPTQDLEQDSFARPPLVRREYVLETGDALQPIVEPVIADRARVRLVAAHDPRPLLAAHRSGAAVGEQVDQHVGSVDLKDVEPGALEDGLALGACCQSNRLNRLDSKRFDNRFHTLHLAKSKPDLTDRQTRCRPEIIHEQHACQMARNTNKTRVARLRTDLAPKLSGPSRRLPSHGAPIGGAGTMTTDPPQRAAIARRVGAGLVFLVLGIDFRGI